MGRMNHLLNTVRRIRFLVCVYVLLNLASTRGDTPNPTNPFLNALPHLDNDDYTSDNPFEKPCTEAKRGLDLPCTCSSGPDNGTYINCDRMVFPGDFPVLPYRFRIHGFSQRLTGYQAFPAQLFTASDVPLKRLDLSQNGVVLITEKLLDGIGDTLEDINLSQNSLGDQLNPIFSTSEFHNLKQLKRIDLSDNDLKALDDFIFKGCDRLQELRLERNSLTRVPTGTLKEVKTLQRLNLEHNNIGAIGNEAFALQTSLRSLNMSHNVIANIDMTALKGLSQLQKMDLSFNKISRLSERLFQDVPVLQDVDLSNNFLSSIPTSLTGLPSLKRLSLSANLIQNLDSGALGELPSLEYLDVSRNNIAELPNGTLSRMSRLKTLQFSVNTLRKVEDDAFRGLEQLEDLYLDDNGILVVPQLALRHVTKLRRLSLSFNRIAVVSGQLFGFTTELQHLSLSYNVIRELPEEAFLPIKLLRRLELRGNQLTAIQASTFRSLAPSLQELDLGRNRISELEALDLPQVQTLKLDHNNLTALKRGQFSKMTQLIALNVSHNGIDLVPNGIFRGLYRLRQIDLRSNNLATLAVGVFDGLANLRAVYLQDNLIQLIDSRTFSQLPQLRLLQLSRNQIAEIRTNAFDNLPQLRKIVLANNQLESVPKSLSRTTNASMPVEVLDLSANKLSAITARDFFYWSKLEYVSLARNRITSIDELAFQQQSSTLKTLDLSRNKLKMLPAGLVARAIRLRAIDVSRNLLDRVSPTAFHNSTQLQTINMSYNRLRSLPDNLFHGITRLHLNLEHNRLNSLPSGMFDRSKIHGLLSIHLGHNFFEEVPMDALQKQFFHLEYLNLASNRLRVIPADSNILVTIKTLDLSVNPLTEESIHNVLSEPKKVKDLNMAATGISRIPVLETPFLRRLNLSSNKLDNLNETVFQRPTLLEMLDLSNNQILGSGSGLLNIWSRMIFLKKLILSGNPIGQIVKGDLSNLSSLETLELVDLALCTRIDSQAFSSLPNLRHLKLYGLPRLESLQSRNILQHITTLERVEIEITEPTLQDQLAPAFLPRIREINVHGRGVLRSISPATLAGLTSPRILFALHDTAITSLPASLLFPVPMSTELTLDLSGTQLPVFSPQFLAAADNHRQFLELRGVRKNPIICDCNARPFRRWLKAHVPQKGFRSRRRPRQIQLDDSSSILVRVSASSSLLGRPTHSNDTVPLVTNNQQANDLVAFKFSNNEVEVRNTTLPSTQHPQSVQSGVTTSTEELPVTAVDGEVFVVTINYEDITNEEANDSSSSINDDLVLSLTQELADVRCSGPAALLGIRLIDMAEEDLSCDGLGRGEVVVPSSETENTVKDVDVIDVVVAARPSRPLFTPTYSSPVPIAPNITEGEPEIIWYNENEDTHVSSDSKGRNNIISKDRRYPEQKYGSNARAETSSGPGSPGLHHMDAVIIGIVGGVVAFVALLIIIICLVRLRSAAPYRGGPMAGALAIRHDKCTCVGPNSGHPMLCHCLPGYPGHALHGPPSLQSLAGIPALPSLPLPLPPCAPPSSRGMAGRSSIYSVPVARKVGSPSQPHPGSTLGLASRSSFYPPTPYYVTFPPESET
ncbi:chaoptin [Daphnia magna]|uniref:Toll receptor 8-like protein n=1 Tax=Daphnia magna TaxID=35525 RepID=A0A164Q054_9CRUS|nr:chaoptin [Daphnia magna]XP_045035065.1 chaoptin [Daphnia magna]KZS07310.1 Toll receptor 8-like protein [Daphnia magna]